MDSLKVSNVRVERIRSGIAVNGRRPIVPVWKR